ncbi:VOC family protein [Chloroflexota bacterium]
MTAGNYVLRPHHCGISVPDLEASIKWYQEMLGFTVTDRVEIAEARAKIAFLSHGEFSIELFEVEGAAPLPESRRHPNQDVATHGTKHIAFEVADLGSLMEELKQRGVDVAMDIFDVGDKSVAFIRDNSGILLELMSSRAK